MWMYSFRFSPWRNGRIYNLGWMLPILHRILALENRPNKSHWSIEPGSHQTESNNQEKGEDWQNCQTLDGTNRTVGKIAEYIFL